MSVNKYLEKFNQFAGQTDDLSDMIGGGNIPSKSPTVVMFLLYFFSNVSLVASFDALYKESNLNNKNAYGSVMAFAIMAIIFLVVGITRNHLGEDNRFRNVVNLFLAFYFIFFVIYFSILSWLVTMKMKDSSNDTVKKSYHNILVPQLILNCLISLGVLGLVLANKI